MEEKEVIETILKSLEEKDKEIETLEFHQEQLENYIEDIKKKANNEFARGLMQGKQEVETDIDTFRDKTLEDTIKENIRLKKQIDLMAEEILKLDREKSKFEYDHARIYDTSEFIKQYFENKAKGQYNEI